MVVVGDHHGPLAVPQDPVEALMVFDGDSGIVAPFRAKVGRVAVGEPVRAVPLPDDLDGVLVLDGNISEPFGGGEEQV